MSNVFTPINGEYAVIGGGDLNSRVGKVKNVPHIRAKYRVNPDEETNDNGKMLKDLCETYKCAILNNHMCERRKKSIIFHFYKKDDVQQKLKVVELTGKNIRLLYQKKVNE